MSCATRRPKVVLPAAGVAEARKLGPSCSPTASSAARCHARSGREDGQGRSAERRGGESEGLEMPVLGRR